MPRGCASIVVFLFVVFVLPYLITDIIVSALARLGLSPATAMLATFGIFLGSLVNIPVSRYERDEPLDSPPYRFHDMFGSGRWTRAPRMSQQHTVIAVNVGGCVIPALLVLHEIARITAVGGTAALVPLVVAVAINVLVCWRLARPVANVGIALPALVPAAVAALVAFGVARPELRAPMAFCAGVLGPLVGADLLHLRDIGRISTGLMSIGGAGTFDGIVVSGLLAILLA